MKKLNKIFMAVFTIVIALTSILKVNAVDNTIVFTSSKSLPASEKFSGAETTIKKAKVGGVEVYAYCFNHALNAPKENTVLTLNKEMTEKAKQYQEAYTYVLFNSMSSKYSAGLTTDNEKYYVTQLAIWGVLFEYDKTNGVNLDKLTKDSNGNNLSTKLQAILANAKKMKADALANKYKEPSIAITDSSNGKMTESGNYYRTGTLKVNGFGYTTFKVTASGSDNIEIVDSNGKSYGSSATFGAGQDFYVRIPAKNVTTKGVTVDVNVSAMGSKNNLVIYASDSTHQNIGVAYKTPVPVSASLKSTATRETSSLVIAKVNKEGKYLAGATLVLKDEKGNVVAEWTTGDKKETNEKTFNDLTIGSKYVLSEKTAPKGYKKIKDITITVKEEKVNYVKVVDEEIIKTKISKQDATTGKELPGAHLVLKDESGKVVDEWTSEATPHYVDDLKPGKYFLTETIAPKGYILSVETVEFTVNEKGLVDHEVVMYNYFDNGVPISKQDATTGKELPGAHLVLKDESGKVVDEWDSTDKVHVITGLKAGKYTLSETIAPEGYDLSTETVTFEVDKNGKVKEPVVMKNYPSKKGVYISKRDVATGEELPGATLIVKDSDGNIIDEWVSTTTPHYIENLKPGTYTLIEKTSPKGYGLSEEVITFVINNDGKPAGTVVMYNSKIPVTGDINLVLVVLGLIGSVALGIFGFKKLNKQA